MLNLSTMNTMTISALFCVATSFIIAFYFLLNRTVIKTISIINSTSEKLSSLPPCDVTNINEINNLFNDKFMLLKNSKLLESWQLLFNDATALYSGKATPSPTLYFNIDTLVDNLKLKLSYLQASALITFMAFFSFILCFIIPLNDQDFSILYYSAIIGSLSMLLCFLSLLLITLSYHSRLYKLRTGFNSFLSVLSSRLVSADASSNTALILRSNSETADAFKASVAMLTEKMNSFISEQVAPSIADTFNTSISTYITPAFNKISYNVTDSLRKLMISYEQTLQEMSNVFFDKLLSSGGKAVSEAAAQMSEFNHALTNASNSYLSMVNSASAAMKQSLDACDMAYKTISKVSDISEESLSYLKESNISAASISESVKLLTQFTKENADVISKISLRNDEITTNVSEKLSSLSDNIAGFTEKINIGITTNAETAETLAKSVIKIDEAGSAQFEKASQVAAKMITDISKEMREALKYIGTDVADSIQSAYKENEKYVHSLTERTEKLVSEYEHYFSSINESTSNIITDMDFTVTNTLNRLSEEIAGIIIKFNESIAASAERYEYNSTNLITSFAEQTRDMGLYAHEINLDITTLSNNLRESVGIFNDNMSKGINITFTEFDKGVAEFTKRMSNTIEAIREAVDNLPKQG